jgi:hypothetical protein
MFLEAHLVAHLDPEFPSALPRHPGRHSASRNSTGLQNHNAFLAGDSGVQKHLRYLRRFAGAGGGYEHQLVARGECADDFGVKLPDWKTVIRHG